MDTVRDLGRGEPWQESLERSLARRVRSTRSGSLSTGRRRPGRGLARRSRMLILSAGGVLALALLTATLTSALDGRGDDAAAIAQAAGFRVPAAGAPAYPEQASLGYEGGGPRSIGTCPLAVRATGYANPLAGARVTPERIDQGVDYAGWGTLTALGAARVTHVAMAGTGWPGAFIEYRLQAGPDRGCYVYYAEGVSPAAGLRVGEIVGPGQPIATIIRGSSSGIEIGWGAGANTKTYAAKHGQWTYTNDADSIPSAAGRNFSALIDALGGPPGKVEG